MEILFYFGIVSIVLLAGMTFAIQMLTVTSLSNNLHELQANRDLITQKISTTMQIAESIDTTNSVFDDDNGTLSLNMQSGATPVQFYLQDGKVYMKEGSSAAVQLNTDSVALTVLRFKRITAAKTPDQIVIDGTITAITADIANLQKEMAFHVSLSFRLL